MNSLEGYRTNGHEYRASEIDRNNGRRNKWISEELKKRVEQAEKNSTDINTNNKMLDNNKNLECEHKMFNPNINKFAKFNNNFK